MAEEQKRENVEQVAWDEIPADLTPDAQVTPNFQAWELWKSETAARHGIDNRPLVTPLRNAVHTARFLLQPIRERFGPFVPNSVYRSQETERALKGKPDDWVSSSQHPEGLATDIEVPVVTNRELALWIKANLQFDQLILELFDPRIPRSGWVHVSLLPSTSERENRSEVLSYVRNPAGTLVYVKGLVDAQWKG